LRHYRKLYAAHRTVSTGITRKENWKMKTGIMLAMATAALQATNAFAGLDCGGDLGRLGKFAEFTSGRVCGGQYVSIRESTNELHPLLQALGVNPTNGRYEISLFDSIYPAHTPPSDELLDTTFSDEYVGISEIGTQNYQQIEVKGLHITARA